MIRDAASGKVTFARGFALILIKTSAAMNLEDCHFLIILQCNALIGKLQPAFGSAFIIHYIAIAVRWQGY